MSLIAMIQGLLFVPLILCAVLVLKLLVVIFKHNKNTCHPRYPSYPRFWIPLDKGSQGEYLIYRDLMYLQNYGCKLLHNIYLPRETNESTELDVILISHKGIFVFESKNYSGWIFGDERNRNWTQTLPSRYGTVKKNFYNPIMQNNTHINCLRNIIGNDIPIYSVVVFSDRCELKKIETTSKNVYVVKRKDLINCVLFICSNCYTDALNQFQIDDIFNRLLPFTMVTDEFKRQHAENIKQKYKNQ